MSHQKFNFLKINIDFNQKFDNILYLQIIHYETSVIK